jgi:hypothetical protein
MPAVASEAPLTVKPINISAYRTVSFAAWSCLVQARHLAASSAAQRLLIGLLV